MYARFHAEDDLVEYQLRDVDPAFHDVLNMCFWQQDHDYWFRRYPANALHINMAVEQFSACCEEIFSQLAYRRPVRWEEALIDFTDRAAEAGIFWWLTGSVSACIRGIPLKPHDVDIMVDGSDIEKITEVFHDWTVEPIVDTGGWLTKDFGVLFQHGRIDIASDPTPALDQPHPADCGPWARNHLETITYQGRTINVPPLALLADTNRRRGRTERENLIAQALDN